MIAIKPVIFPLIGTAKYFEILLLSQSLPAKTARFHWTAYSEIVIPADELDEQPTKKVGALLLGGSLEMTESEYAQWGTDDNYAVDWAMKKLNFHKL